MGKSVLLFALILASLPTHCPDDADTYPAMDLFGNVYPTACRRDLSHVKAIVIDVDPEDMDRIAKERHSVGRLWGLTWARKMILLDSTLEPGMRAEVLHHELCHVLVGPWHKER